MHVIAHRGLWKNRAEPNSLPALEAAFQAGYGVETDLRSFEGKLYLSHDAIIDPRRPARFEDFLKIAESFPELYVFLNIKEDGLGNLLAGHRDQILKSRIVFFDMSVPQLVQYAKLFTPNQLATRFSEYEPTPSAQDLCDWIWVDAFIKDLSSAEMALLPTKFGKKLAFVSSELHGRDEKSFWATLKNTKASHTEHAICTDLPAQFLQELKQ